MKHLFDWLHSYISGRPLAFGQAVENFERDLIIEALKQCNGNQTKAAERLETSLRIDHQL